MAESGWWKERMLVRRIRSRVCNKRREKVYQFSCFSFRKQNFHLMSKFSRWRKKKRFFQRIEQPENCSRMLGSICDTIFRQNQALWIVFNVKHSNQIKSDEIRNRTADIFTPTITLSRPEHEHFFPERKFNLTKSFAFKPSLFFATWRVIKPLLVNK